MACFQEQGTMRSNQGRGAIFTVHQLLIDPCQIITQCGPLILQMLIEVRTFACNPSPCCFYKELRAVWRHPGPGEPERAIQRTELIKSWGKLSFFQAIQNIFAPSWKMSKNFWTFNRSSPGKKKTAKFGFFALQALFLLLGHLLVSSQMNDGTISFQKMSYLYLAIKSQKHASLLPEKQQKDTKFRMFFEGNFC